MSANLRSRIEAELDRREPVARALGGANALRRYQHARKVLARHEPYRPDDGEAYGCAYCGEPTECFNLTDLAESLGLEDR